VAAEVPDFPPGTRAKALLASSRVPNMTGRLFFGVTMLTPSRFFSAGDRSEGYLDPPAMMTCQLARALTTWLDNTVQPEAEAMFASPVVKLHNAGSYACRNRNHDAYQPLSEHALANGIDIPEFVLASGVRITVLDNWPKNPFTPPLPLPNPVRVAAAGSLVPMVSAISADQKSTFVKHIHDDACHSFGTVLGPDANEAHKSRKC
jgi:hypothetical protein